MSFVVALTGGIGSGKSAAADAFAALGAHVVDTDVIAHRLTAADGAAIAAIREAFGPEVIAPDGALDRAAMRQRVFADGNERKRLEAILHPMIRAESLAEIERAAGVDFPYAVLVVPLLVESASYRERADRIAVVDCARETQIARVMARNGMSRAEVEAILAAQATRIARLAIADDIIPNDGSRAELQQRIAALHQQYLELAANRANFPPSGKKTRE